MLDLPVLFLPLAALKPTSTGPADDAAGAPLAVPTAIAPTTGPAVALSTGTLSTGTQPAPAPLDAAPKANPFANVIQIALIGGMFVLLYFVMFRPQKKAEKERKSLISAMKKGDRVMTIGGLVARVVSIDDDDVVLKIDESANVKATYKKSSIQQILDRDDKSK